jgi:hypothetical protein
MSLRLRAMDAQGSRAGSRPRHASGRKNCSDRIRAAQTLLRRAVHEIRGLRTALPAEQFRTWQWAALTSLRQILATRRLEPADRRMRGRFVFRTWRRPIELNVTDLDAALSFDSSSSFGLARELYCRNVYLRAFEMFSAAGSAVVDLGGNRGFFSLLAFAGLDAGKVFYIEPDGRYESIVRQLTGPAAGDGRLEIIRGFVGGRAGATEAPMIDLDTVLAGEDDIAFLKVDIEGAEEALFHRDSGWLGKVKRIAMEAHPMHADVLRIVEELHGASFCVLATDPMGCPTDATGASFIYASRDPSFFANYCAQDLVGPFG